MELQKRLEFRHEPGGTVRALLHVTMPDGAVRTFEATAHPDEVSGLFSGIWHAVKSVAHGVAHVASSVVHVVRKVATSKVFKIAAIALAAAATPILGPGPAALVIAASSGLGVASKLVHAGLLHHAGHSAQATNMALEAHRDAMRIAQGNAAHAREILTAANRTRLAATHLAEHPPLHVLPKHERLPERRRATVAHDPVAVARAGRMLSSSGAPVTPEQLRAAHASGRVFWVMAA
jgi:hypothetical protein